MFLLPLYLSTSKNRLETFIDIILQFVLYVLYLLLWLYIKTIQIVIKDLL